MITLVMEETNSKLDSKVYADYLPAKLSKIINYFALFVGVFVTIIGLFGIIISITNTIDISGTRLEQLGEAGVRLAFLAVSILLILTGIIITVVYAKSILSKAEKQKSLTFRKDIKKFDIGKYFKVGIIVIAVTGFIFFTLKRLNEELNIFEDYVLSQLFLIIRFSIGLFFIILGLWAIRLYEAGRISEIPWYKFRPHYELTKILTKSQLRPFNLLLNLTWILLGILIGISAFVYDFFNSPILFLMFSIVAVIWSIPIGYVIKYRRMLSLFRNELIQLWFTLILEVFFCILFSLIFLISYGWISL
jgi:MFS family permease